jgi:hypothetical protein
MKQVFLMLTAVIAAAQTRSELMVEPRTIILEVEGLSAKLVCPQPGNIVTIVIVTAKKRVVFKIDPRTPPGEKYINPATPSFFKKYENKRGRMNLVAGASLVITTADGRTQEITRPSLAAGLQHDILRITCTFDPTKGWVITSWGD